MTDLISAAQLKERIGDPSLRIIDATVHLTFDEEGAHAESGRETYLREHLPGAVFVDQIVDLTDPDGEAPFAAAASQQFAHAVGALGVSNDSDVVVYDQVNGVWATRLWWQFGLEGLDGVRVLDGGLDAWRSAGFETASGEVPVRPASFSASRRPERTTSTQQVESALEDPGVLLVNALDPDSFSSGHIPGSVNVPVAELLHADGTLKSVEELRTVFESVGALDPGKRTVTYCGGGIAATAAAFALTLLGRDDVSVYDGSLNAWTADDSRPLTQS